MDNLEEIQNPIEIEGLINKMPAVISSRVIIDENQEIEEIHVLASNDRSPKQISRDIQSALTAKFPIKIDYKKISVAQIDMKEEKDCLQRFKIASIGYSVLEKMAEVKVTLQKGEESVDGYAKGTNSKNNLYRLTADATLSCVHELFAIEDAFILEDIEKVQLAKKDIMNVAVTFMGRNGEELLVGAAIVRKDEYEAIVKATLDAINRKVIRMMN
ncbi:MAG: hypothetical protein AB2421_18370 [Thermotaleaceae bacterium]